MAENGAPAGLEQSAERFPVLVVEDDAALNRLIQKTLQKAGFSTEGALNGAEAIAKMSPDRDLLLLLDYSLPDMTARELVETLQAQGRQAPFVVMTGYGDERIAVEMMKLHARDYLVKDAHLIQMLPSVIGEVISKTLLERRLGETQEALRTSEACFDQLAAQSRTIAWEVDADGLYTYVSRVAEDVLGYRPEELTGRMHFYDLHPEAGRDAFKTATFGIFALKEPFVDLVNAIQTKSGGMLWVSTNGIPLLHADGTLRGYRGFDTDITERRLAEEERRRLATAIEHAAEAVVITDAEGFTRYVNSAMERMFGHTRDTALGAHIARIVNSEGDLIAEKLGETAENGAPWSGRIHGTHLNGTGLAIEVTASPIRDDQGRTEELVIILRDITKESAYEARMRQTQKLEAIGTLAGGIAHDFNNILSAILGYTQMALTAIPQDSQAAEDLQQVAAAGRRAAELVRQILTFGRRQEQAQPEQLRLDLLAAEALAMLRASIPSTIEIRTQIAENCDSVVGDPSQLNQVIVNLCTNAYHAMEKSGGLLEFSIEMVAVDEVEAEEVPGLRPGPHLLMTVRDSGCGMDPAVLERAIDPFFTTKPQGKGTGLGLSLAHGIVRSHDGAIDLQSAPEKGTTVRVWLPTVKMTAERDVTPTPAAPLTGHGERILLLDDEALLVKLSHRILSDLGYAVTPLTDANEAFALFSSAPGAFDLMVTDQTMPHCTGLELAARVRAIRPDFPILLLTGIDLVISEEDAAAAGVAEVLGKPVTVYKLARAIGRALAAAPGAGPHGEADGGAQHL
jgi:PAS domain S-box-containing protein